MQYNVLNTYEATVHVVENPYQFEEQQLFDMALRINKKRSFLFVSKVLGKHLAVCPQIPLLTSHLLAYRYMEVRFQQKDDFANTISEAIQSKKVLNQTLQQSLNNKIHMEKPLTIIGFAETATALGHAFFETFTGNVRFIHTTRELLLDQHPAISFEEEHSHASSHRVYAEPTYFEGPSEIVLVDDEMTTGKTNLNIIRQLHEAYPHLTTFTLVSILDWRNEEHERELQAFARKLGIIIHTVSLFKGAFTTSIIGELPKHESSIRKKVDFALTKHSFDLVLKDYLTQQRSHSEENTIHVANYYNGSGRFSLSAQEQSTLYAQINGIANNLATLRSPGKCLVLGTGEFMYIPMLIAAQMGEDVMYHATTRSPIFAHADSIIKNKFTFNSAEYPGAKNYLYNIPVGEYQDIFIVYERILDQEALAELVESLRSYAENIHIVTLGGVEVDEISTR